MNLARKEEVGAVTSTAGHLLRNKIVLRVRETRG